MNVSKNKFIPTFCATVYLPVFILWSGQLVCLCQIESLAFFPFHIINCRFCSKKSKPTVPANQKMLLLKGFTVHHLQN